MRPRELHQDNSGKATVFGQIALAFGIREEPFVLASLREKQDCTCLLAVTPSGFIADVHHEEHIPWKLNKHVVDNCPGRRDMARQWVGQDRKGKVRMKVLREW